MLGPQRARLEARAAHRKAEGEVGALAGVAAHERTVRSAQHAGRARHELEQVRLHLHAQQRAASAIGPQRSRQGAASRAHAGQP